MRSAAADSSTERLMTATILLTGPELVAEAMEMAARRQVRVVPTVPYMAADELRAVIAAERPDAIIVRMGRLTEPMIAAAPSLKIIAKHGVGVDSIDLEAAARRGIPVTIALGANAQSVAEHALGLMLSVAHAIPYLDRRVREGHWDKATHTSTELAGKSLGIVGAGSIGRLLIELVASFRMTVRIYDPFMPGDFRLPGTEWVDSLNALLEASDVVSLHCPVTPQTRHMIGTAQFGRMRPGAILINTARGDLIDTDALVAALASGRIAGAGLDTFSPEPPPAESPLLRLPNVVATPHVGANSREARNRVGVLAMHQVLDCLDGRPLDEKAIVNRSLMKTT